MIQLPAAAHKAVVISESNGTVIRVVLVPTQYTSDRHKQIWDLIQTAVQFYNQQVTLIPVDVCSSLVGVLELLDEINFDEEDEVAT